VRAGRVCSSTTIFENATVRRRDWYKLLDAPVLTLNVTVRGEGAYREVVLGVRHALLRGDCEELEGALDVLVLALSQSTGLPRSQVTAPPQGPP